MSHYRLMQYRGLALTGLVLALLVMGGCSSPTGPSSDKVRLDLLDRLNAAYYNLLKADTFRIDDRQVLSEDRVKFHVEASYKINEARAQQIEHSTEIGGATAYNVRQQRRRVGKKEKATITYKRTAQDVWQMYRIQMGYQ